MAKAEYPIGRRYNNHGCTCIFASRNAKCKQTAGINNSIPSNSSAAAQPQVQQNQNLSLPPQPAQQSAPPPPAQTPVTEEKFSAQKPKLNFSDMKVIIIIGILFVLLFVVPLIIFRIKKNRKENPPPSFNLPIIPPPAR